MRKTLGLLATVAALICSLLASSAQASTDGGSFQDPPEAYRIYEHISTPNRWTDVGEIPVRVGYYDPVGDRGFGYEKIRQKHPPYDTTTLASVLNYGKVTGQNGTSYTVENPVGGTNYRVVIDLRWLDDDAQMGVITAYPLGPAVINAGQKGTRWSDV